MSSSAGVAWRRSCRGRVNRGPWMLGMRTACKHVFWCSHCQFQAAQTTHLLGKVQSNSRLRRSCLQLLQMLHVRVQKQDEPSKSWLCCWLIKQLVHRNLWYRSMAKKMTAHHNVRKNVRRHVNARSNVETCRNSPSVLHYLTATIVTKMITMPVPYNLLHLHQN